MVLSAILQTAWAVNMLGKSSWDYPLTTWVEAFGGVRSYWHPLCPVLPQHRKPLDLFSFSPPINQEGEKTTPTSFKLVINQLSVEELAAFNSFSAIKACCGNLSKCWDDLSLHVLDPICYEAACSQSYGLIGLLSDAQDVQAIVYSGASMTITANRSDFISYKPMGGQVLKGITKGAAIAGVGVVHWQVEVNGQVVDLKI